uniref:Tight junction protein ZO-3 n=1 Tax=Mus musculus TaxID=10090 RepID=ZO3_MOUSE|nr:RecName: Full=Tight junction protein ZO-3; AltName: Full=Tight junction protein 3; AltName: Full=Zona occludens protein 3; AltName: Full=Zonula occludens protein 3 [Mus musculus]AAF24175.1 tight junction-associtated protein ZO-3 [Mus musculus]
MEELTIWEQHTATLYKDPRRGFGIAVSGGHDRASGSVVVSDVVPGSPAEGRLRTGDHIVMVNGVSVENVTSAFAIQILKTCTKTANVTVKRPRRVQLPATKASPASGHQLSDQEEADHGRGYEGDSSSGSGRSWGERSRRSRAGRRGRVGSHGRRSSGGGSEANGLDLVSGYKRLPKQDVLMRPLKSVLVKRRNSEEFGVKLGSQIFIKHITESGLAARNHGLQEGDLILQINGVSSANLSLSDTRRLIEKSEGELTLLVLRDSGQFLVNIPPAVSDSDSSLMEDISDLTSELSQAPPSHVPPPPLKGQRSPEDSQTDSPVETPQPRRRERSVNSRAIAEPESPGESRYDIYRVPSRQSLEDRGYSPDTRVVSFPKGASIGLRLAGGNDVGIFVSGVQAGSPADGQGIQEGDEILQVNGMPFRNLTREEAVQFLLGLPPGEDMELVTQSKTGHSLRRWSQSRVGDSFYIRTHFELEPSPPYGLGFTRGDVFHVVDTLYPGSGPGHGHSSHGGLWLAARMGRDLREQERGVIPNQSRAEQLASLEAAQRAAGVGPGASVGSNPRAEFWRLRSLRRGTKKASTQRSREDLSALTRQGHYPPYERVVLREASFKRPVVILGPVADIAMKKLTTEMPEEFEIAESMSRTDSPSKIIKLDTVRVIAERDKHALLDVTPSAIERLNYVQYYPIVIFCAPESRPALKALREWLAPASRRSSRRLYAQAQKLQKHSGHLFTATIPLHGTSDSWYQEVKAVIQQQQARPIWTAEDQLNSSSEDLDLTGHGLAASSGDLSCDSRTNSDYEDTDGEGAYTDREGGPQDVDEEVAPTALARSSEPVWVDDHQGLMGHGTTITDKWETQADSHYTQDQRRQDSMRTYKHEALRKKFTRARDVESSDDEGYDWGPATDL